MPIDLGPEPPLFKDMMQGAQVHPSGSTACVSLAEELKARDSSVFVIGFLRHFECELCQKKVRKWSKSLMPKLPSDTAVLVVSNGSIEESANFVQKFQWPAINLFTDPELNTYGALSFAQGVVKVLNMGGITSTIGALVKGGLSANHLQLGGVVVVDKTGYVRYFHREAYAGDHAPLDELAAAVKEAQTPYSRKN